MREHTKLPSIDYDEINENSVIITLLNARSYNKHKDDIKSDRILMESDILCLTETQIPLNSYCDTELGSFNIIPNNSMDRFSSLLIGYQQTAVIFDVLKIPGAMIFKVLKRPFYDTAINVLLLYRKNCYSREESLYLIQHFVENETVDILLGDFNINALSGENYFLDYLTDYKQVVNKPTHISGSLIDHIYVRNNLFNIFDIQVLVKNVYFSDHEAIKLRLQKKIPEFKSL